ncbi:DMT family transporter [Labilibaculum sp.]|uniref:DMT family transporter n=1 Tax=Labilibaculum sp. TaxID=2060723 RepID=UPI002AA608E7|nr:DMT family transporter [Labilibaculum sp.]MBN2598272.1 DMT family transporter [Marinifilaceae bacterium]
MILPPRYNNWILLILVSFLWGSPYILREIALESFSHNQVAAFQVFFSFLLFIPLIIKNIRKLSKENILPLLLSGITGNIGPAYFFAKAQTQINSSVAGMLNAMLPMVTLLIAILFFKAGTSKKVIGGILLAFAGTVVISFSGNSFGSSYFWGVFYVFMAILSIAVSINIVSFSLPKLSGTEIASLAFLFVGPMAGCFLAITDLSTPLASESLPKSALMLCLLAVLTFVGVILYNQLIKKSSHVFAASIAYIIPIIAIFLGIVIGGDSISIAQIASIFIILVGVHLTHR